MILFRLAMLLALLTGASAAANGQTARQPAAEIAPAQRYAAALEAELLDPQQGAHRLSDVQDQQLLAVVFIGTECPLARLYVERLNALAAQYAPRGVAIVGINANAHDTAADVDRFSREHGCRFPIWLDPTGAVADRLGATRQLEVFVLDEARRLRYHGRVDDQFLPGERRAVPSRHDLAAALDELLAGQPVLVPETSVAGCFLDRPTAAASGAVTYSRHIAPLLARHCQECHRPGQIGPFSLTSYDDAAAWAETIRERVAAGVMPPWNANPRYGHFANERRLTDAEKRLLDQWIEAGLPEGDPADVPPALPQAAVEWNIGPPDQIVTLPEPIDVPASGVLDLLTVEVDPGFTHDTWIRGAEVFPSQRSVLHHCTVVVAPPSGGQRTVEQLAESAVLAAYVPGQTATLLPSGMARKVPAGWHIYFHLHYVPNGAATRDQTRLGLVLADRVEREVLTSLLVLTDFSLRPQEPRQQLEQSWLVPQDMLLLSMIPHMHLRGKSFRYEAQYADGQTEVLLDVPAYDFMWQHQYVLAAPKRLPAGTRLRGVAVYDNSPANPHNPDPTATVRCGPRSSDEMFNGWFECTPVEPAESAPLDLPLAAIGIVGIGLVERRCRRSRAARD